MGAMLPGPCTLEVLVFFKAFLSLLAWRCHSKAATSPWVYHGLSIIVFDNYLQEVCGFYRLVPKGPMRGEVRRKTGGWHHSIRESRMESLVSSHHPAVDVVVIDCVYYNRSMEDLYSSVESTVRRVLLFPYVCNWWQICWLFRKVEVLWLDCVGWCAANILECPLTDRMLISWWRSTMRGILLW